MDEKESWSITHSAINAAEFITGKSTRSREG
jgi:hypothetical protein